MFAVSNFLLLLVSLSEICHFFPNQLFLFTPSLTLPLSFFFYVFFPSSPFALVFHLFSFLMLTLFSLSITYVIWIQTLKHETKPLIRNILYSTPDKNCFLLLFRVRILHFREDIKDCLFPLE